MLVAVLWIFAGVVMLVAFASLMGLRLRRSFSHSSPPAWAEFFSSKDFELFLHHLEDSLNKLQLRHTIANGIATLFSDGMARQIPVHTFAEACRGREQREWDAILAAQLSLFVGDSTVKVEDFDRVKDSLRLQMGIPAGLPETAAVAREDLPGVLTVLVLDSALTVRTINPVEAASWNHPVAELMQIALDHVRGMPPVAIEEIELTDDISAFTMTGDSPFTASHALLLQDYPKLLGTFGTIVAVPTSHILLAYPITSNAVQDALFPLAWIASRRYQDGPGSITPRLYWHRNGRFTHLPYELNGEKFTVHPPADFADMLASLRGVRR